MENILLIESNNGLREALTETLQYMGYCVYAAGGGREGLELAGRLSGAIDLVVSELVMHDMNAMQLHSALQELTFSGNMLIITGYPMPHSGASLLEQPNITWARKPIGIPELRLILAQLTNTRPG